MILKIEPANGEVVIKDRTVIGHYEKFAVIEDESGELYRTEDKERTLQSGELYMGADPEPVSCLPENEQRFIYGQFGSEV